MSRRSGQPPGFCLSQVSRSDLSRNSARLYVAAWLTCFLVPKMRIGLSSLVPTWSLMRSRAAIAPDYVHFQTDTGAVEIALRFALSSRSGPLLVLVEKLVPADRRQTETCETLLLKLHRIRSRG